MFAAGITVWIAGGQLDPGDSITLPSNPINEGPLHQGRAVIALVLVVVPLVAALVGGLLGDRFHRAVDRAGTEEFEAVPRVDPAGESDDQLDSDTEAETETKTQVA